MREVTLERCIASAVPSRHALIPSHRDKGKSRAGGGREGKVASTCSEWRGGWDNTARAIK